MLLAMSGICRSTNGWCWTLPLGFRAVENAQIIREELNETGAIRTFNAAFTSAMRIWDQPRWSDPDVKQIMYQFKDIHDKEFGSLHTKKCWRICFKICTEPQRSAG